MKIFQSSTTLTPSSVVKSGTSSGVVDLTTAGGYSIVSNITVDTNAAGVFSAGSLSANKVTITAHGWKTGIVGQVTTAGTLPTGLVVATNYWVIVIDANTVSFASSQANALAGTAITLSGGSGNSTFTPTALAGATVQAQWSNDGVTWVGIGSATAVSAATVFGSFQDRPPYRYAQHNFVITSGSLSISSTALINKDS